MHHQRNSTQNIATRDPLRPMLMESMGRSGTQRHMLHTQGCARRHGQKRNLDTSMLTTSRLPDLAPRISPNNYMEWRFQNPKGSSAAAFDRSQLNLQKRAQAAIDAFNQQMMKEEKRLRDVKKQDKGFLKDYHDKVDNNRRRWDET